jgi:endonuclease YncB( thermonuclease family)
LRSHIRLTAITLLILLVSTCLAQEAAIYGRCVAIVDGDTIQVFAPGRPLLRIRLAFCDAPEMGQAFGYRAKQAMSELVFGKEVELRPHTIDRYGRTVAMVFVDGRDVGLELIKAGLAWAYDHYLPEASPEIQAQYPAAETAARVSRLGLWVDSNPLPPWEYRKAKREQRVQARLQPRTYAASPQSNLARANRIRSALGNQLDDYQSER